MKMKFILTLVGLLPFLTISNSPTIVRRTLDQTPHDGKQDDKQKRRNRNNRNNQNKNLSTNVDDEFRKIFQKQNNQSLEEQVQSLTNQLNELTTDMELVKIALTELHYDHRDGHYHKKSSKSKSKSKKGSSSDDQCKCPTLPPIQTVRPTQSPKTDSPSRAPSLAPTDKPEVPVKPKTLVLPLGDSLTKGQKLSQGAYRGHLYNLMLNNGYTPDFVGTINNLSVGLVDKDHEGKGGETIDQISERVDEVFKKIPKPDVILLHCGTNDFGQENSIVDSVDRYEGLIRKLARLSPTSNIIATTLIKRKDAAGNEQERIFNPFIPDMVEDLRLQGIKVSFVDMHQAVRIDQLVDGIHPNVEGYKSMAKFWMEGIKKVIKPNGDSSPPVILSAKSLNDTKMVVVLSKPLSNRSVSNLQNFKLTTSTNTKIQITSARLDETGRKIIFTTTDLTPYSGVSLTLTIRGGVTDRTEDKIPLSKFSSISFDVQQNAPTLKPGQLPSNKLRIMPLGSTLTKGVDDFPGAYRKQVFQVLKQQGYNVDFVGTKVTNRFPNGDPHHEGTTDKMISFFDKFAEFWLDKIETPDVILLHAGIFDFSKGVDLANIMVRMESLLDTLHKVRPYTRVLATNLITKTGAIYHDKIEKFFNPFIEDLIKKKQGEGYLVNYVDLLDYVTEGDVTNEHLLNQQGYDNMGDAWANAIQEFYTPFGDKTTKPHVYKAEIPSANLNEVKVTYTKPVNDATSKRTENYSLSNGINILNAVLGNEKRVVTLMTSSLNGSKGSDITLNVQNIVDLIGNKMDKVRVQVKVPDN